jgi:MFS family permease
MNHPIRERSAKRCVAFRGAEATMMASSDLSSFMHSRNMELRGAAAIFAVGVMIGVLFAGSTVLTPLYVIYKQQLGFSQITLTLIYAVYVLGNLAALLVFGKLSDAMGRRRVAVPAMAVAIVSALIFLFAQGTASLYIARILSGVAIGIGAGVGTAWLSELIGDEDKSRATRIATSANFVGLGLGSLLSGLLAQSAPGPLHLPFVVYLVVLLVVAGLVFCTQETILRAHRISASSLRPQLSLPREMRGQFIAPAITGFGSMALVGFYAALAPSLLTEHLHEPSHAVAGAVFFELAIVVAGTIVATQRLSSRAAMLWALALMIPAVIMVVAAQLVGSMAVMIVATAFCGVASGLGYRGSLQVANQIAPEDRRAELVSSYFVCAFIGNAVPVIGIGVLSTLASSNAASLLFASMIIVFSLGALFFGARYTPR